MKEKASCKMCVSKSSTIIKSLLNNRVLAAMYKTFTKPHIFYLGYGDIIYDQSINSNFQERLESTQNMSARAITGAIRDTSKAKLYREVGLESLCFRT